MWKCEQIKKSHNGLQLQTYVYDVIYVHPDTITKVWYLPDAKYIVPDYKKRLITLPVTKNRFFFSYICTESYELYLNVDDNQHFFWWDKEPITY